MGERLRVAYVSPFVPPEWLEACGAEPLRLRPRRDPRDAVPAAGACAFARAALSAARGGGDVFVFATTCDQMRRAAERAAAGGARVFLLNVPATWQTPAALRLYREELERLARALAAWGGRVPDPAALADAMRRQEALREEVLAEAARRGPRAFDRLFAGPGAHAGPEPPPGRRVPLALVGGPLGAQDAALVDRIASIGGHIVLDGTETGARTLPPRFDRRRIDAEPVAVLVEAYAGSIPDVSRRPDDALYAWLRREVPLSGARGVLLVRPVWCDPWAAHAERIAEATGRPVLSLDLDGDAGARPGMDGRIEAFLEMLR